MKNLYLETKNGKEKINEEAAEKYHLEAGTRSPFTGQKITGSDGLQSKQSAKPEKDSEEAIREDFYNLPQQGFPDDEIDQMDNGFELSQSEILDFAAGTDSRVGR